MLDKLWHVQLSRKPRVQSRGGVELRGRIHPRTGGSNPAHHGALPRKDGGKTTEARVAAVIGEAQTGGVSAGGKYIARRKPLPMDKDKTINIPLGDTAFQERCITLIAPRERLPGRSLE